MTIMKNCSQIKKVNDKYSLFAIGPSLIYDTRNNQYSPTKGIYTTLSYEKRRTS